MSEYKLSKSAEEIDNVVAPEIVFKWFTVSETKPNGSDVTYSLDDYLPKDGKRYMVLFRTSVNTASTGYYSVFIQTDIQAKQDSVSRTANINGVSGAWACDHIWLPVGAERTVTYKHANYTSQDGTYAIECEGYYRF